MTVSFDENRLTIDGKTVELEKPIYTIKEISDRVIVVFDEEDYAAEDPNGDRNVIAVDRNGAMLWRIQNSVSPTRGRPGRTIPFSGVGVRQKEEVDMLIGYDAAGMCYEIDPETGKLSNPRISK